MKLIKRSLIIWFVAVSIYLMAWTFLREKDDWVDGDLGKALTIALSLAMSGPAFNELISGFAKRQERAVVSWRPVLKEYLALAFLLMGAFTFSSIMRRTWIHHVSPLVACQDHNCYLSALVSGVGFVIVYAIGDYLAVRSIRRRSIA